MSHLNPSWRKYRTVEAWFSCCDLLLGFIASKRIEIKNRMPCLIIRLATTCTLVASKVCFFSWKSGYPKIARLILVSLSKLPQVWGVPHYRTNPFTGKTARTLGAGEKKICQLRTICKRSMENQTCLNPLTPSEIVDHPLEHPDFFHFPTPRVAMACSGISQPSKGHWDPLRWAPHQRTCGRNTGSLCMCVDLCW
jgi:hypothetical protein